MYIHDVCTGVYIIYIYKNLSDEFPFHNG